MQNPLEKREFNILFAEDDLISQKMLLQFAKVNHFPYIFETANSYKEAREKLLEKNYDVILTDYYLGDGTGIELVPYAGESPLIIITGAGDEETAIKSIKSGASDYLVKNADNAYFKKIKYIIEGALYKKNMEKLLNMHSQAIQNVPDSIFFIDTQNKFIYVNNTFCKTYLYEETEVLDKNIGLIWDENKVYNSFFDKKFSGEYIHKRKNGKEFPVSLSYSPIVNSTGKVFSAVGISRDITEQKKTQLELKKYSEHLEKLVDSKTRELREIERLAAIGETAAMVGHDLRNPLQVLVNTVYIAKLKFKKSEDEIKGKQKEIIDNTFSVISEQIDYMNKIVSDLQDFAKEIKPNRTEFNIEEMFEKILNESANFSNIRYEVDMDENAKVIFADKTLFQRVIINLLTNARNAIPKSGTIKISIQKIKGSLMLIIQDSGIGIPEDVKSQLFKPLFTTRAKGTGLGLSVCKRIVDAHNGTISIDSVLGKGTKVIIILPQ